MTSVPVVTIPRAALHVLARADRGNFTLWQCDVVPPSDGDWLRTECWVEVADRLKPGDLIIVSASSRPFWTMLGVAAIEKDGDKFTGVQVLDIFVGMIQVMSSRTTPEAWDGPPPGSALN